MAELASRSRAQGADEEIRGGVRAEDQALASRGEQAQAFADATAGAGPQFDQQPGGSR